VIKFRYNLIPSIPLN